MTVYLDWTKQEIHLSYSFEEGLSSTLFYLTFFFIAELHRLLYVMLEVCLIRNYQTLLSGRTTLRKSNSKFLQLENCFRQD